MQPEAAANLGPLQEFILTTGSALLIVCTGVLALLLIRLRRTTGLDKDVKAFMERTPWQVGDAIAFAMLLFFLLQLARMAVSLLLTRGIIAEESLLALNVTIQVFIFHIPIFVLTPVLLKKRQQSVLQSLGIQTDTLLENISKGIIVYLATVPVALTAALVWGMTLEALGVPQAEQLPVQILIDPNPRALKIGVILLAIASAPVAEEILFRGICFPALAKGRSPLRAAVLTSLLFSAIHLNAYAFFPLFVLAMILCASYALTRSIVVPITVHALFNGVQLLLFTLTRALET